MKFFTDHITLHHLKRNPHKWLLAVFLSPIHHAQMRYKNQYHLKFEHAKKLFVFDMILLLTTIVLFGATIFWWQYNPTITALVHLDVSQSTESTRLRNGDDVTLSITYTNESDIALVHPILHVTLPSGFIVTNAPLGATSDADSILTLPLMDVPPGTGGSTVIQGQYYGSIDEHQPIQTMLIYTQDGKQTPESDIHRLFLTAREPSVDIMLDVPRAVIPGSNTRATLTVKNMQQHALPPITLLSKTDAVDWGEGLASVGTYSAQNNTWHIGALEPNASATWQGTIRIAPTLREDVLHWHLDSLLHATTETAILEYTPTFDFSIGHPHVQIIGTWSEAFAILGDQTLLTLSVKNTGNIALARPSIVYAGKTFFLDTPTLVPNQTMPITIPISVQTTHITDGQNGPILIPDLHFSASISDVDEYVYTALLDVSPLPIGTTLSLSQRSRYYTAEGDQLGRGPLPPQVGKETKYWIFTQIQNTVGGLEDVSFSTKLAPGVTWTGKSSVSKGNDISFQSTAQTATWRAVSIEPNESVGIYFEIAVTPGQEDLGTIPQLLTSSLLTAHDPYVDNTLTQSRGAVYADLSSDAVGKQKGVVVQ